jgi:hypothetical protein
MPGKGELMSRCPAVKPEALPTRSTDAGTIVTVPEEAPRARCSVVVLDLEGKVEVR